MHKRFKTSGFTLIELLITLSIIALLIAIPIPSYQYYVLKTKRDQAKIKLTTVSLLQADHFSRHQAYTELRNLAVSLDSDTYLYSIKFIEGNKFEVIATAVGNQRNDTDCRELSLAHNLVQQPKNCW